MSYVLLPLLVVLLSVLDFLLFSPIALASSKGTAKYLPEAEAPLLRQSVGTKNILARSDSICILAVALNQPCEVYERPFGSSVETDGYSRERSQEGWTCWSESA